MICADVSSAGVGLLCFLKSTFNTAIYQDILEHFMLPQSYIKKDFPSMNRDYAQSTAQYYK